MKAGRLNNYGYNNKLQSNANGMRKDMTKAEACLWKYALRAGSMKGYTFRRQRPVLNYIADFMCIELRLIIEVDGLSHQNDEALQGDDERDAKLKEAGFTTLRFKDEEVLKQMHMVIENIRLSIEKIEMSRGGRTS